MSGQSESVAQSQNTREAIMDATYRTLCEHGYADLTTQVIADESDVSKATLHYHYDTKEELLLSFLDRLYESFTEGYGDPSGETAVERLVTFVDAILHTDDEESAEAFRTALLEIKAQAPYVESYREKLATFDAFVREEVESIVSDGVSDGVFREDVDPTDTSAFVATLVDGVITRRISIGETNCGARRAFLAYVRDHLVAPETDVDLEASDSDSDSGSDRAAGEGIE